jgi:hypothetical protein
MKMYGGGCIDHVFLTSVLVGGEWSAARPCSFIPGEGAPNTHWIGGWVGPRAGLDDVEKRKFFILPGLELRTHSGPACSQLLYRLRYPGSYIVNCNLCKYKRFQQMGVLSKATCFCICVPYLGPVYIYS